MSILDEIDDVLTDWHGSADSAEWTAEPKPDEWITIAPGSPVPDFGRGLWFDKQGQPIDSQTANTLLCDRTYSVVAVTRIRSRADRTLELWVSTVWLGVNYNFTGGPPALFETMVFGGRRDGHQWRYSTEGAALDGHAAVAELVAAEVPRRRVEACERWYRQSHLDARYRQRQRNRRKRR